MTAAESETGPAGRTLAVGDIHGCSTALDAVLGAANVRPGDVVVTLGDLVDRGPDTRGVLDRLTRWEEYRPGVRLVPLRGNHELMLLAAAGGGEAAAFWLECGGDAALASYAPPGRGGVYSDIPGDHLAFLRGGLSDFCETETHFFVHANALPDWPLAEQPPETLFWEFWHGNTAPHENGKIMVCGHTRQRSGLPRVAPHAVCIDTGACRGGWLSCLHTESGRLWQANQAGETRTLWLDEV